MYTGQNRAGSACAIAGERPQFKIVSIMPGMDVGAPERTDTRSGLSAAPNFRPVASSRRTRLRPTSSSSPWGHSPSAWRKMRQHSVEMVNPGGTGSPALLMAARLAPLPPRTSLRSGSPSVRPAPKKYVRRVATGYSLDPRQTRPDDFVTRYSRELARIGGAAASFRHAASANRLCLAEATSTRSMVPAVV